MRKFNVNVNGKSYVVEVEETDGSAAPVSSSASAPVQAPVAPVSATAAGGSMVKAPMPGLVLKFSVENGATVKKGDRTISLRVRTVQSRFWLKRAIMSCPAPTLLALSKACNGRS